MPKSQIIPHFEKSDIDSNRFLAALSYLWILFLIPLIFSKHSEYAKFHAKQGLVLFLSEIVGTFLYWIPLFGQLLLLALIFATLVGFIMAFAGKAYSLPFIGSVADKINI